MKILSLDQSLSCSGYSIHSDNELITYGIVKTNSKETQEERMEKIVTKMVLLIEEYDIDKVVLENIQSQKNPKTYRILSMLLGVLCYKLHELKIPFEIISPTVWRSTLNINKGKKRQEKKKQAQDYVESKFNIRPTEDECDSICLGLAYLHKERMIKKLTK